MQHSGTDASQPFGQGELLSQPLLPQYCGGPPKQRRMPFESALQTSFFPLQQFWDAFTSVLAPQMLPGGLHAPPFGQRLFVQTICWLVGTESLRLQQSLARAPVELQ